MGILHRTPALLAASAATATLGLIALTLAPGNTEPPAVLAPAPATIAAPVAAPSLNIAAAPITPPAAPVPVHLDLTLAHDPPPPAVVPAPGTIALLGLGLLVLARPRRA